jgi:hypothetical protein
VLFCSKAIRERLRSSTWVMGAPPSGFVQRQRCQTFAAVPIASRPIADTARAGGMGGYSHAYRLAQTRTETIRVIAPRMLMAMATERALTKSVTVRTIVPAAVEIAADTGITKPITSNPVRVGVVMTAWYQMVNKMVRRSATATAYASNHRHDGISNGSA